MERPWFRHVAAPMVGQSDLPFRLTAVQYGATATWTCVAADRQMFHTRDIDDRDTRETLVRALEIGRAAPEARDIDTGERTPQIVQLAGDCPDALVRAARARRRYASHVAGHGLSTSSARGSSTAAPRSTSAVAAMSAPCSWF